MVLMALTLFIGYIAAALFIFREIPRSISDTFYMYNDVAPKLGYIFTAFMTIEAFLIASPMTALGTFEWWQFLGFLCPAGLAFCGCAPLFKGDKFVKRVHFSGAILSVTAGLTWCYLLDPSRMIGTLIILSVSCAAVGVASRTNSTCRTFWLEIVGFGTITSVLSINVL